MLTNKKFIDFFHKNVAYSKSKTPHKGALLLINIRVNSLHKNQKSNNANNISKTIMKFVSPSPPGDIDSCIKKGIKLKPLEEYNTINKNEPEHINAKIIASIFLFI